MRLAHGSSDDRTAPAALRSARFVAYPQRLTLRGLGTFTPAGASTRSVAAPRRASSGPLRSGAPDLHPAAAKMNAFITGAPRCNETQPK